MTVAIPLPQIKLTPGSQLSIKGVSWEDFEGILIERSGVWDLLALR